MREMHDNRITPEHLRREAIVYVRQSSPGQVRTNKESTRIQMGFREKAIELGFKDPTIIDDDLGVSASGFSDRPGFQKMLARVVMREVGIILCVDASRLSRNSKDWANLFELCSHFDTLIADLDQVYDLARPNDRLVLGIKGTVSELELSIIKNRLKRGAEEKAARGKLKYIVPPGYTHDHDHSIILDPDKRVRNAIGTMFDQFERCSSMRQLAIWYRDNNALFPVRKVRKTRTIEWEIPSASTLRKLLQHPIYAGVYTYGRRYEVIEYRDGKLVKRTVQYRTPEQCRVCIHDNHPAYISWERFLANQDKIAQCRPRKKMDENPGPVREGRALLAGILRCGHCGAKISVAYRNAYALYYCDGGQQIKGERRCLSFGSKHIDLALAEQLCNAISPLAIDASRLAMEERRREWKQNLKTARMRLQDAQYEADRAFERLDLVDPKNRLVAESLEERLNQKLQELLDAKEGLRQVDEREYALTEEQSRLIQQLARDFPSAWDHPKADIKIKKRIIRTAIEEVVATHQPERQMLEVIIHWRGGVHTKIHVPKRATPIGSKTDQSLIETVKDIASLSDAEIARILNMKRITSPKGLRWSKDRVRNFRNHHHIQSVGDQRDEDHMTGQQVAERLGVSRHGVEALIQIKALHNYQITEFAPWRIPRAEVESDEVRRLVKILKETGRLPKDGLGEAGQRSLFPEKSEDREK